MPETLLKITTGLCSPPSPVFVENVLAGKRGAGRRGAIVASREQVRIASTVSALAHVKKKAAKKDWEEPSGKVEKILRGRIITPEPPALPDLKINLPSLGLGLGAWLRDYYDRAKVEFRRLAERLYAQLSGLFAWELPEFSQFWSFLSDLIEPLARQFMEARAIIEKAIELAVDAVKGVVNAAVDTVLGPFRALFDIFQAVTLKIPGVVRKYRRMRALKKSLEKINAPGEYVVHRILWNEHKYSVYKEIARVVVNVGKSLLGAIPGWGSLAKAVASGVDKALGVLGRIMGRLVSWINRYREITIANGHLSSMRYLQAVAEGPLFLTAYVFKNFDEMDRMQSAELSQIADTCLATAGLRCTHMGERVTRRMAPVLEELRHTVV